MQLIARGKTVADFCRVIEATQPTYHRWRQQYVGMQVVLVEDLSSIYPAPAFIRSDNCPEFIALALRDWCEASPTTSTAYIAPGSPWENGFAGRVPLGGVNPEARLP